MAKRTRKQKQRAVTRRPTAPSQSLGSGAPGAPSASGRSQPPSATVAVEEDQLPPAATSVDPAASMAVQIPASESGRRRVERVSPASPAPARVRTTRGQTQGYIQSLESEDAAIPFDRVPYVPADLRRVAVIATVMIVLIIVADIVVSNVVK